MMLLELSWKYSSYVLHSSVSLRIIANKFSINALFLVVLQL